MKFFSPTFGHSKQLKRHSNMPDIRELPIVMCSMSRWDNQLSSAAYSLAKELAKTNQVFYFDYPYTYKDYWQSKNEPGVKARKDALLKGQDIYTSVAEGGVNFKAVTPRLMVPFYFLPAGAIYDGVEKINNARFFKTVKQVLRDHTIEHFIFFNSFSPFYGFEMAGGVKPDFFVYQTRDNLRAIPELAEHGPTYERMAAKNADLVIATSSRLQEILEEETNRTVHLLPNAAQIDLFVKAVTGDLPRPGDFPDTGKKVIGFIGNVGPRMDFQLLDEVMKNHPDKDFVMVGPDNLAEYDQVGIGTHKNLHLTGPKKLAELPAYLKYMDVTIIPFLKDELTRSIYPLKLNEQLAAGRAIVTTDFSEDIKNFEDAVYVARDVAEFSALVNRAIAEDSPEKVKQRMQRSEGNAWSDRVEQFWQLIEAVAESRQMDGKKDL